ncbi:MAG: valine--tRNA ligase, partial [Steroidobacteraceae bacterium]
ISVATTRPETLLGDSAVAVHPQDERYANLIGRRVQLPLTTRLIPVIADSFVEREFGSGVVKITPAHDFNDYEVGQRHSLPLINIFTPDAKLNENAPGPLQGLDRFVARRRVLEALDALGLIERIDKHKLMVPRGDRSGAVIEPYLTDQWYVKIAPLARPALAAVQSGRIRFVPENWNKTYYEWMHNIRDWCISRQLWWGHQIPAWYDELGNIYVARDAAAAKAQALAKRGVEVLLTRDADVLDTWFSSALWPFSTLGWPRQTSELQRFYPGSVLVTGFDIIFFWVARMIMFGLKFMGDVPFREVYVHGLVRDAEGQKMSKSRGNVIDPLDIVDGITLDALLAKRTTGLMQPKMAPAIEKATRKQFPEGIESYGTDALRFTFAALATQSRDIRFDMGRVGGYRNFCNKLWNASRFVMMMVAEGQIASSQVPAQHRSITDRWIHSRLAGTIRKVDEAVASYRFDFAATALYEFTWYDFCDWYLEFSKPVLQSDDAAAAAATRRTLLDVLETLLRALHPIMPFITEEIWQKVAPLAGRAGPSLMLASWPKAPLELIDAAAESELDWIKAFILGVRQIRGEMDISPSRKLPLLLRNASGTDGDYFARHQLYLERLAGLETARIMTPGEQAPPCASALLGELQLLVPMAGIIDPAAEAERLSKRLAKIEQDLAKTRAKLENENFVRNAPPEIVNTERERIAQLDRTATSLRQQIEAVRKL